MQVFPSSQKDFNATLFKAFTVDGKQGKTGGRKTIEKIIKICWEGTKEGRTKGRKEEGEGDSQERGQGGRG